MSCGVKTCSSNDDRFLYKCEFCNKRYHAACVGVQRNKEIIITAFMVPMCAGCQDILRKEADVMKMLHQQEQLVDAIRSQTDANHRIAADLKKFCLVSELFDCIEHLLHDVKETLKTTNNNNQSICSAVDQHMKSRDSYAQAAIAGINESVSMMSQKITSTFDDRLSRLFNDERLTSLKNEMSTLTKNAESLSASLAHHSQGPELREILDEVKLVAAAISTPNSNTSNVIQPHQRSLEEELLEKNIAADQPQGTSEQLQQQQKQQPKQTTGTETPSKNDPDWSGWRILGNKHCRRQDWSGYDLKLNSRQLQEKAADKARQRRKRRKQQQLSLINSHQPQSNTHNNKLQEDSRTMGSDKELLSAAKAQFSGPPSSIDHPIAALSVPKLINFRKGETINPYRPEKQSQHSNNIAPPLSSNNQQKQQQLQQQPQQQPQQQQLQLQLPANQQQNQDLSSTESRFELDPLRPPIVRLTEQSTEGDGRFLKARLRDPKIMRVVRLFLAYMKDQPATVCVDGMTSTSIRMHLASEGLPLDPEHLLRIFKDVHQEYGMDPAAAMADLQSYQKHLSSERTHRLQQQREAATKFYRPLNFHHH